MTGPVDETGTPTDAVEPLSAAGMAEAGAKPVEVDAAALLAMIQDLQGRLDAAEAARPAVTDPVAARVRAIKDHMEARARAVPARADELSELKDLIAGLEDKPAGAHVADIREALSEIQHFEGLEYISQLAKELGKLVKA